VTKKLTQHEAEIKVDYYSCRPYVVFRSTAIMELERKGKRKEYIPYMI